MHDAKYDRRSFLKTAAASAALSALNLRMIESNEQTPPRTAVAATTDLCFMSAQDLAALIRTKKVSAREVMAAHLERINRINPTVNAIVARLDDEQCLALADGADARAAKGERLGPLHGLPIAFKDLQPAVGFPFTRGSTDLQEHDADGGLGARRAAAPGRRAFRSGRRTRPSSAWGLTPITRCTGPRSTRTITHEERGRVERWRRRGARELACCRSPTAVTWADRSETPGISTTLSACVRR